MSGRRCSKCGGAGVLPPVDAEGFPIDGAPSRLWLDCEPCEGKGWLKASTDSPAPPTRSDEGSRQSGVWQALYAALESTQWGNAEIFSRDGESGIRHYCPICDRTAKEGHAQDCTVGAALEKARGSEE